MMNNKLFTVFAIVVLVAVTSAACGGLPGGPEATLTPIPPVVADIEIVAEGRIVPRDSVQLSFLASGQVNEVLVEEGSVVKAGDVVARLGNREQLEASIANANTEVLAAQQALDVVDAFVPGALEVLEL